MSGMHSQSSFHRYRIEVISQWPESAKKQTALTAARAALMSELAFERDASAFLSQTATGSAQRVQ